MNWYKLGRAIGVIKKNETGDSNEALGNRREHCTADGVADIIEVRSDRLRREATELGEFPKKREYEIGEGIKSYTADSLSENRISSSESKTEDSALGSSEIGTRDRAININSLSMRKYILILFGVILFYLTIKNIAVVTKYAGAFVSFFTPFILGAALAFIINVPMTKIENLLFGKLPGNPATRLQMIAKSCKRPVSMVITLILVFGVITVAVMNIVPQLANTLESLAIALPGAIHRLEEWIAANAGKIDALQNMMSKININFDSLGKELASTAQRWASTLLNSSFSTVSNILNGIVQFVIGLIFSIYVLLQKEKLSRQGKQVVYAFFREETADKVMYILGMTKDVFKGFISVQCVDGIINGILFFIILTVLGIPYAIMISIVTGFMALIPIIGSFIGAGIGIILILIVDPSQVFYFILMYVIIQQLDGNVIYPLIAGNTVGLPSIWVLMAVTVGGSMMGVLGMVLFIPICSVVYQLTRYYVFRRLECNSVPSEKWENPVDLDIEVLDK
ncbi:MAG: AI-2E family transporter [Anaerovoracaceae bacterium]|nr:AI-2E family transporter [Anaerovoracaceae bacterium]